MRPPYSVANLGCPSNPARYKSFDTTVRTCLTYCAVDTYALETNRSCVDTCPNYYYTNYSLTKVERRCVSSCPNETFADGDSHCVKAKDCPPGEYGDPINKVCTLHCPSVAATGVQLFADTDSNVKMCVYVCPEGFYIKNITNAWECVSECGTSSMYIDYVDKKCVTDCPDGTFAHTSN